MNAAADTIAEHPTAARPVAAAAATPAAPRVDLYAPIHKALRLFMTDTLRRVGCMDAGDDGDTAEALEQVDALLASLRHHVAVENEFKHPALEARQPGSAAAIAGEHEEHLASIDALAAEAAALRSLPAGLARDAAALRMYRHLALFVAENFEHMQIEETRHNALLWQHYGDTELLAMLDAIVAHVAPDEMARILHWMAPALSHGELSGMLAGMQAGMPADAFRGVLGIVEPRLPASRWNKLARSLGLPQAPNSADAR